MGINERVDALERRVKELEHCLTDIEKRLREDTEPISKLINEAIVSGRVDESDKRKLSEAWKWGVYGSCIAAQIVLKAKIDRLR